LREKREVEKVTTFKLFQNISKKKELAISRSENQVVVLIQKKLEN